VLVADPRWLIGAVPEGLVCVNRTVEVKLGFEATPAQAEALVGLMDGGVDAERLSHATGAGIDESRELLDVLRGQHDVAIFAPIDLVLVPGIAFTRAGARIGRGAGFFDRFLAHRAARAIKIGIAFSFQIVESLPLDRYDVKLDLVVSD